MIESLSQSELSTLMASEKRGLEISVRLTFGKAAMEYIQQISWALELQFENQ